METNQIIGQLALSSTDTDEPFRRLAQRNAATWAFLSDPSTTTRSEIPSLGDETPRFLTLFDVATGSKNVFDWSPRPVVTAQVIPNSAIGRGEYYFVQIPTAFWKAGDLAPGDWIANTAATAAGVNDPLSWADIESEIALEKIERFYEVLNERDVKNFLQTYPSVESLLLEAIEPLGKCFPEIDRLILEVFKDPERELSRELVCTIVTTMDPAEALEKLDRFDQMWFLDQLNEFSGVLNFRIDFV